MLVAWTNTPMVNASFFGGRGERDLYTDATNTLTNMVHISKCRSPIREDGKFNFFKFYYYYYFFFFTAGRGRLLTCHPECSGKSSSLSL